LTGLHIAIQLFFMTNSTFNPTCAGNGSVNIYVYSHLVSNFFDRGKCSLLMQNRSSPTCVSFHKDYNFYPKQMTYNNKHYLLVFKEYHRQLKN